MYKVGDTVVIRPDIYDDEEYENVLVVQEMEAYHGMEAIITNVDGRDYRIDVDGGEWYWTASMFCGTKEEYEDRNNWNKPFTVDMLNSLLEDREVCVSVQSKAGADALFLAMQEHGYPRATLGTCYDAYGENTVYWLTAHGWRYGSLETAKGANYDHIIKYTFYHIALDDLNIPESVATLL